MVLVAAKKISVQKGLYNAFFSYMRQTIDGYLIKFSSSMSSQKIGYIEFWTFFCHIYENWKGDSNNLIILNRYM